MLTKTSIEKIKGELVNKDIQVEEREWQYFFFIDEKMEVRSSGIKVEDVIAQLPAIENKINLAYKKK